MQDLDIIIQPELLVMEVVDTESLAHATNTLSILNSNLDKVTAHKEAKTKPLNNALKAIRADYKPIEEQLTNAISSIRLAITTYATAQAKIAKEQEARILADKRTNLETKITKLANVEDTAPSKVSTDNGSITFTTVKKWRVTDESIIPRAFLQVNEDLVKQAMKENSPVAGIEYYEEQSLRNYR